MARLDSAFHNTSTAPLTLPDVPTSPRPSAGRNQLDRDRLHSGIAMRQQTLARLESAMVTVCEQAAARGAARSVSLDDRETWDRTMWQRYLNAAAELERDYGPRMRRLHQEIDRFKRLLALPLAA